MLAPRRHKHAFGCQGPSCVVIWTIIFVPFDRKGSNLFSQIQKSEIDDLALAKAQRIALGNFGTYDMTGSRDAIVKLIKCRDALVRIQQKELEQSKAAPIPQPKRHAPIEPVDQRKRSSEDTIEL